MGMLALSPASSCSAGFLVQEKNACAKQLGSQTVGLRTGFSISTARPWTGCTTSLASIPKSETALRRARPREVLASLHPQPERAPPRSHLAPRCYPGGQRQSVILADLTRSSTHSPTHTSHTRAQHILPSYTHSDTPHPREGSHTHLTHLYTLVHIHTHIHSHISQIHPHTCSGQSGIHA